jgi:glycosyltransferase involved in cell wall biosynthesis
MKLKIAILGTRGIPNQYGGYEQAATSLAAGLAQKGHFVTVYNSHNHPYHDKNWNNVEIIHCYDPEYLTGTVGQFIYDLNCIFHARRKNYDAILQMGYTSSSIWGRFYPKKTLIISNMDGLEWKRSKYSAAVQHFLRYAEKLAIKYSDYYIADSPAIQNYLLEKYKISSEYIPYGAAIYNNEDKDVLNAYDISPGNYCLLIARMEPENNIETILNGFLASASDKKFIVVGNTNNQYGKNLRNKFGTATSIRFIGALYDQSKLHSLRAFSSIYFHGHSVGGTNPSLLEAMASRALIVAHDNPFNKTVLGMDGYYFSSAGDIENIIRTVMGDETNKRMIRNNLEKIKEHYNWEKVIEQYENFIFQCYTKMHS